MKIVTLILALLFCTGCYKSIQYPVLLDDKGTVGHVTYTNWGFDTAASNMTLIKEKDSLSVSLDGYNSQADLAESIIAQLVKAAAKGTP